MDEEWNWHPHRFTDEEVAENLKVLKPLAQEFLVNYEGDMEFLLDVKEHVYALTHRQVRGVLNCMKIYSHGLQILKRGPKPEPDYSEPAWINERCPYMGQEHDSHWFPLKSESGRKHCLGWHAMTRDITTTRARFHKPYLRGQKSNVIHRSTHKGIITWFPERFHEYGPVYAAFWEVGRGCTKGAAYLKNPDMLTAEEVKAAEPVPVHPSTPHKVVTLCKLCFPGTDNEPVGVRL